MRRLMLVGVLVLAGCGSPTPTSSGVQSTTLIVTPTETPGSTSSPTPEPTPTPVPTPLPSLPAVDVGVFGEGWTLAASSTNTGDAPGTKLRSTIGKSYSVMAVCTGEGPMTVTLRASGGDIKNTKGQPPGVDVGTIPVDCPAVEPTVTEYPYTATDDYHGVRIVPTVTAPDGVTYIVLVGTHG